MTEVRPHAQGGLAAVGDAHALLHDPVGGQRRDFLEEPLVVDVRHVHHESAFLGQLDKLKVLFETMSLGISKLTKGLSQGSYVRGTCRLASQGSFRTVWMHVWNCFETCLELF